MSEPSPEASGSSAPANERDGQGGASLAGVLGRAGDPRSVAGYGLSGVGVVALVTAVAWWWLVYSRVVDGDYLTYREAAPCLLGSSDLCSLAQALCGGDHFLGIRRYSAALLWAGFAMTASGALLATGRSKG